MDWLNAAERAPIGEAVAGLKVDRRRAQALQNCFEAIGYGYAAGLLPARTIIIGVPGSRE